MKKEMVIPTVLSATTIINTSVENSIDEKLGKIEELMVDLESGRIGICSTFVWWISGNGR